jgi:hypothetical protein
MHDPVMTRNGHSYERATIYEHLKRSKTDPLTREPLSIDELRPNYGLKAACDEFWESGASDWIDSGCERALSRCMNSFSAFRTLFFFRQKFALGGERIERVCIVSVGIVSVIGLWLIHHPRHNAVIRGIHPRWRIITTLVCNFHKSWDRW